MPLYWPCRKLQSSFQAIEIRAATGYSAYLDVLTPNTYIMVVSADPQTGACGVLYREQRNEPDCVFPPCIA